MNNNVKFEGTPVKLGDTTYVMPPLTFGQLKKLRTKLAALRMTKDSTPDIAQMDVLQEVILQALQRNYPELTSEVLDDQLDMVNVMPAFLAVMGQSGLVSASGEGKAAS